jgi:hemerythrin-like domain-containing protein
VNLDIFSPIRRVKKRGKAKDEFDKIIDIIEKFAPKEHLSEREAFYYNYRMMEQYKRPLLGLLETASQISLLKSDQEAHARKLFSRLKAFYDVTGKLTMAQAVEDISLVRRFRNFFTLFYGRKDLSGDDIREWLIKID